MGHPLCLDESSTRHLLISMLSLISIAYCNPLHNSIELWHGDPHTSLGLRIIKGTSVLCDGSNYDPQCLPKELLNRSLSCETDLQGIRSLDNHCIVNTSVEVVDYTVVASAGTLEIHPDASLSCYTPRCNITIVLLGNLVVNGCINSGMLIIQAHNVMVDEDSAISARGLGGDPPAKSTGTLRNLDGVGGGYGGQGENCMQNGDKDNEFGGDDYGWDNLENPWSYGSQGGSTSKKENYGGGGGGRVNLTFFGVLEVLGRADADGESGGEYSGGGFGDSAVIRASKL